MSYSFGVRGATKSEALEKVAAEMAKVVQSQPVHSEDQKPALAAAAAFVGLLVDDGTQDVTVSMSGSLWVSATGIRQASVNVSAGIAAKETA